jgi:hypothetical protein
MTKKPYLYHVTELKNFNSIMENGLIPGYSKSSLIRGAKEDYGKVIWLDSEPAIWSWAKRDFKNKNWILLRITTRDLDQRLVQKATAHFYIYHDIIHPKNITRLSVKSIPGGMAITGYYRRTKQ